MESSLKLVAEYLAKGDTTFIDDQVREQGSQLWEGFLETMQRDPEGMQQSFRALAYEVQTLAAERDHRTTFRPIAQIKEVVADRKKLIETIDRLPAGTAAKYNTILTDVPALQGRFTKQPLHAEQPFRPQNIVKTLAYGDTNAARDQDVAIGLKHLDDFIWDIKVDPEQNFDIFSKLAQQVQEVVELRRGLNTTPAIERMKVINAMRENFHQVIESMEGEIGNWYRVEAEKYPAILGKYDQDRVLRREGWLSGFNGPDLGFLIDSGIMPEEQQIDKPNENPDDRDRSMDDE